jgi:hypothetical protein
MSALQLAQPPGSPGRASQAAALQAARMSVLGQQAAAVARQSMAAAQLQSMPGQQSMAAARQSMSMAARVSQAPASPRALAGAHQVYSNPLADADTMY